MSDEKYGAADSAAGIIETRDILEKWLDDLSATNQSLFREYGNGSVATIGTASMRI